MPLDSADHYENFPVGSILLPRHLREPIAVIYRFARRADDIADEGDADAKTRLEQLDEFRRQLDRIDAGRTPEGGLFVTLGDIIARHKLPLPLFRDLLDAFSQDVVTKRYATFAELMDYCRRSADPVGRLLLNLFEFTAPQAVAWSDAICSSLQLINFWQDVAIDWRKDRVYLPQDDMAAYGVSEAHIANGQVDARWQRLMGFEIERSRALLKSGASLGSALPGRIGLEIRAIVAGGATILDKLEQAGGDVFRHRPVLNGFDWLRIIGRALLRHQP